MFFALRRRRRRFITSSSVIFPNILCHSTCLVSLISKRLDLLLQTGQRERGTRWCLLRHVVIFLLFYPQFRQRQTSPLRKLFVNQGKKSISAPTTYIIVLNSKRQWRAIHTLVSFDHILFFTEETEDNHQLPFLSPFGQRKISDRISLLTWAFSPQVLQTPLKIMQLSSVRM